MWTGQQKLVAGHWWAETVAAAQLARQAGLLAGKFVAALLRGAHMRTAGIHCNPAVGCIHHLSLYVGNSTNWLAAAGLQGSSGLHRTVD